MIGGPVTDISKITQFPDTLVIGRYRCDAAVSHERFTVNRKRIFKSVSLPADEQASEQAYMSGQHPAVPGHAPNAPAVNGCLLVARCRYHDWPPSNSLVMSSNL